MLRLAVRLESYLKTLCQHHEWRAEAQAVVRCGGSSFVRGLECGDEAHAVFKEAQATLRARLDAEIFPLLSGWCLRCVRDKMVTEAAV